MELYMIITEYNYAVTSFCHLLRHVLHFIFINSYVTLIVEYLVVSRVLIYLAFSGKIDDVLKLGSVQNP